MKKTLFGLLIILSVSCSKNSEIPIVQNPPANALEANLGIGIKPNANLSLVFNTINNLGFDIRQMNGFFYYSNTSASGVPNLINLLNQKPYINTGAWSATPYSVFYDNSINKTLIANVMHNMNSTNQADFLNIISTLNLEDKLGDTKNLLLSVPEGTEDYWKSQMLNYSFVKWSETYNQVCLDYVHAPVSGVNVPTNGNVNQIIPISLNFTIFNGCGSFGNITETNTGNTKTLTVNAKYEGCICTLPVLEIPTTYNFRATTTGNHIIKFAQPDGTFLNYSINIQ